MQELSLFVAQTLDVSSRSMVTTACASLALHLFKLNDPSAVKTSESSVISVINYIDGAGGRRMV
jgi:hypothetical protein